MEKASTLKIQKNDLGEYRIIRCQPEGSAIPSIYSEYVVADSHTVYPEPPAIKSLPAYPSYVAKITCEKMARAILKECIANEKLNRERDTWKNIEK